MLDDILQRIPNARAREDIPELIRLCTRGRTVALELGDRRNELTLVSLLASTYDLIEQYSKSYEFASDALTLAVQQRETRDEIENRVLISTALQYFGLSSLARQERERALTLVEDLKDARTSAAVANRLALDLLREEQSATAAKFVTHSLRLTEYMQSYGGRGSQLHTAARVAIAQSQWDDAQRYLDAAVRAQSMSPSRRWDAEFRFVEAQIAYGRGELERANDIAQSLPSTFDALNLHSRAVESGLFAMRLERAQRSPTDPSSPIDAIDRAFQSLRQREHHQEGQLVMRLRALRREAKEVQILRDQLLNVELNLLNASLSIESPKHPVRDQALGVEISELINALTEALQSRSGPITLVNMTFDPIEVQTYDALKSCQMKLERGVARNVKLMARSPSAGYFLIPNAAHRKVQAGLLEILTPQFPSENPESVATTYAFSRPVVAAVVAHRRLDVSAMELLSSVDRLAKKTPRTPLAPTILRLRRRPA